MWWDSSGPSSVVVFRWAWSGAQHTCRKNMGEVLHCAVLKAEFRTNKAVIEPLQFVVVVCCCLCMWFWTGLILTSCSSRPFLFFLLVSLSILLPLPLIGVSMETVLDLKPEHCEHTVYSLSVQDQCFLWISPPPLSLSSRTRPDGDEWLKISDPVFLFTVCNFSLLYTPPLTRPFLSFHIGIFFHFY